MYIKFYTKKFQKSFNKILRSGRVNRREVELVVDILASGHPLDAKYQDHELSGEYVNYRECHIKFDLLLIYQIKNQEFVLVLINKGTHSELF